MVLRHIPSFFGLNSHYYPATSNTLRENLISRHGPNKIHEKGFPASAFALFGRLISREKPDGSTRTEEEDKVHNWLYALARTEKSLTFEYVQATERGLSFKEADRRLKEIGPNVPLCYAFPRWWQLLWNAFFHPFNIILIVLSVLSFISSDYPNGCIMLILVFISVSLRFFQEFSSSKAAMKLSEFLKFPVKVQRCAGRVIQTELIVQIDQRDIVPGDIISFGPGDLFPSDVRLLTSKDLVVSQSSLTGESGTMEKIADIKEDETTPLLELRNICFMGTSVVSGSGTGLVVSTGSKTYISTIFSTIGKQKPPDAFEKGVRQISYVLVGVMLVIVTVIILVNYYASHDLSQSMLFGISVASALTPQMLPLIVNTNLAKGALAMARDRCIVKSLAAIQNMGVMDILCMDKTGTLTMDRAIMIHHLDGWGLAKEKVLRFAFLNSYFKTELKNPVDDAILAYVYTSGYRFDPAKWRKTDEITFDFIRRRVSVIIETDSITNNGNSHITDRFMITKGALEEVIKICCFVEHIDRGVTLPLSQEDYERIIHLAEELSNDGLRVLGVATKKIKGEHNGMVTANNEKVESNMVFLGLITFFDPPKESAKQALWRLAEKGVKAKVLTGDSLSLAIKVCKEVGIRTSHVITGPDLELLDHSTFHETVKRVTVLARLTPTQKLRVVQSLQSSGNHIVGFLGDGINDSLALDAANVGISVDSGACVAKDIADIILLEKDLNVLVAGVERGRFTYGNTIKYIKMSVIANIGSVVSLLIATLFLPFEPLTPRQLLTQSFMYSVGQIAIPWDKMEEDYVKIPQKWSLKGLLWFLLWNAPVCSICDIATLAFLCLYYGTYSPSQTNFFHSAWFIEGLFMQTLIIHLVRTEKIPFIQEVASWPLICSTVLISGIGIAIPFTPIGKVMGLGKLPLSYFGFLVVLFLGYFSIGQVVKRVYILIYKQWL
ncbi:magnesium-transporting ATPase, P-type 1-like [Macadamia integrifolia]|uniref:magnesium-transporting ATPase, P-type 1-like n=1 Tax=Macadamia integrifolia TaxID=60698 RepID=UPI001C4E811E|nr:magnesium-transporting ATPase, P-type 1-like [Macadamia integrifolia]